MLEIREMEELLDHEDHSQLFSASQLLALLLALVGGRSNKLETFCDKISLRFKEEAEAMVEQLAKHGEDGVLKREDAVLKREDAGVVDDWTRQLQQMYEVIAAARPARHKYQYALVSLALNMTAALQPLSNLDQLLQQLAQLLVLDLEEKQLARGDRSGLRGFLVCANTFYTLDQEAYSRLLEALNEHLVEPTGPEDCLDIFLDEAEHLPPTISDRLFNKAVLAFEGQKSSYRFIRIIKDFSSYYLSSGGNSKVNNLTRLFSHCLCEIRLEGLVPVGVIQAVSQQATVANMMRFYPHLAKLNKLEREVTRRAEAILDAVAGFRIELHLGEVSLFTLGLLHSDEARVERLIALYESLTDVRPSEHKKFSTDELKALIKLRREELAVFHKAADSVRKFVGKFDVAESPAVSDFLAQFSSDPTTVELRQVCRPREAAGQPIVLRLRAGSTKDLATMEQHNRLYESAVFRIIHDEVWEASER